MSNPLRILIVLAALLVAFASAGEVAAQTPQTPEPVLIPKLHFNLKEVGDVESDASLVDPHIRAFALTDAAPSPLTIAGCTSNFLTNNFSSRAGILPRLLVLHYTVSPNVAGTGDVNAIRNFFQNEGTDASSTTVIDFEGNCQYIVREGNKPWTQTFYNPWSISVEIIATGRESKEAWLAAPGLKKVATVFAAAAKRHNIPIRWVDPSAACVAPPAGITDHNALDCQNNHTDVMPNFPYDRFMQLVRAAAAPPPAPVKVEFVMGSDEGQILARSTPVTAGGTAEEDRYRRFLANWRATGLKELRADGDIRIVRRKVG